MMNYSGGGQRKAYPKRRNVGIAMPGAAYNPRLGISREDRIARFSPRYVQTRLRFRDTVGHDFPLTPRDDTRLRRETRNCAERTEQGDFNLRPLIVDPGCSSPCRDVRSGF